MKAYGQVKIPPRIFNINTRCKGKDFGRGGVRMILEVCSEAPENVSMPLTGIKPLALGKSQKPRESRYFGQDLNSGLSEYKEAVLTS
jgi:hypothetical protein